MSTSPMPHPDDLSVVIRKPHVRQEGIYLFVRESFDTEMHITEPNGDSYLLTWADGKLVMRGLLEAPEMFVEEVSDALWNFYSVAVNFDEERFVPLRTEQEGWEDEIALAWNEAHVRSTEGIPD